MIKTYLHSNTVATAKRLLSPTYAILVLTVLAYTPAAAQQPTESEVQSLLTQTYKAPGLHTIEPVSAGWRSATRHRDVEALVRRG